MLKDSVKLVRSEFSLVMFCLNALDRLGIHRLVDLDELKSTGDRKILANMKSDFDDSAILIEYMGVTEERQRMYRFVYKIFSNINFTYYSAEFVVEADPISEEKEDSLLNNVKLINPQYSLTMLMFDILEKNGFTEFKGLENLQKPGDRFSQIIKKTEIGEIEILLELKQIDDGEPVYRFIEKVRSGVTFTYVSAAFKLDKTAA